MDALVELRESLERGEHERVSLLTRDGVDQGMDPEEVLSKGLIAGMNVIGEKYRKHEIFLPDVLLAAKAMYAGMDVLKPLFLKEGIPTSGTVVMGTVHGDLHDIGKNLVSIMLKGAGFDVIDLGNNVPAEQFIQAASKNNAAVIGMSALLTTTMPAMRRVVELLNEHGLGGKVRTIVGGAPVSAEFAKEIGADAYGYDSTAAVARIKDLMEK